MGCPIHHLSRFLQLPGRQADRWFLYLSEEKAGLRAFGSSAEVIELVGGASTSTQVFSLTSHFLPRELYKMFLGSKCQMSRTHSCSSPEPGGSEGLEIFPEEACELGLQRGQLCASLSWHLETLSVLATFSLVENTCEATDSLMEKQTSIGSDSLPTLGALKNCGFSRADGSCSS